MATTLPPPSAIPPTVGATPGSGPNVAQAAAGPLAGLVDACGQLYPKLCCRKALLSYTLDDECAMTVLSKSLGYGIIAASALIKLPQLLKIFRARSSAGLSFVGTFLELLAITFTAAYSYAKGFPFSAWGEAPFLLVETFLIAYLILAYGGRAGLASLFGVVYVAAVAGLLSGRVPLEIMWYLQAANLPLAVFGKLIQAGKNFAAKHTGQMSAVTVWCLTLGCAARVWTSHRETGDLVVVYTYVAAGSANLVLALQILWYWSATNKFLAKKTSKKRN